MRKPNPLTPDDLDTVITELEIGDEFISLSGTRYKYVGLKTETTKHLTSTHPSGWSFKTESVEIFCTDARVKKV
ncbi:hypothetical protein [Endozoicomonas ascidiicola]|uniref:hypothetical protein n=1 Tax=Endozoicomonas ascidiicola TaxID=1698521 RepID=UPI000A558F34|nr:hypothetical protein [Endozoicomonas ascidiicola]